MSKVVTPELLDSFDHLVERIIAEVELVNALSVEERGKNKQLLVPNYLCAKGQLNSRTYLVRGLRQFAHLLSSEKTRNLLLEQEGATKEPLTIEQLEMALLAILYAECLRRPLFEYWAAERLKERIREDARKHFTTELVPTHPANVEMVEILIKNHKIAALIIGKRLSNNHFKAIWDELKGKQIDSRILGLLAAAYYDTPSEHTDRQRLEKAESILTTWASSPDKYEEDVVVTQALTGDLEKFVILYDLPICNVDKDGCRIAFALNYLEKFCQFAIQELPSNAIKEVTETDTRFFLSFHYEQSRHYAFNLDKAGEYGKYDGIIRHDLSHNNGQMKERYEIVERKDVPKGVRLFEFRFKREYAYALALGVHETEQLDQVAGAIKSKKWADIVYELATGDLEESLGDLSISMTPLKEYLSLAHFMQLCEIARIYEHEQEFASLCIEISGSLDESFPNRFTGFFPKPVIRDKNKKDIETCLRATEKKAVTTYAVNTGILAGLSSLTISCENESEWGQELVKSTLVLMGNTKTGFELLLRYIEQYNRGQEVTHYGKKVQINKASYQMAIDDSRILERYAGDDWWSIGIDIGGTAIKIGLYKKFERQDSFRLSTQKEPGNPDLKYDSLVDFAKRLIKNGVIPLIQRNYNNRTKRLSWDDIKIIGISWPGAIRDGKIAGASGIFKYFKSSVASNLIRENTVEGIRKLNLTKTLEKIFAKFNITVAICNDGIAEALGRVLEIPAYRSHNSMPLS